MALAVDAVVHGGLVDEDVAADAEVDEGDEGGVLAVEADHDADGHDEGVADLVHLGEVGAAVERAQAAEGLLELGVGAGAHDLHEAVGDALVERHGGVLVGRDVDAEGLLEVLHALDGEGLDDRLEGLELEPLAAAGRHLHRLDDELDGGDLHVGDRVLPRRRVQGDAVVGRQHHGAAVDGLEVGGLERHRVELRGVVALVDHRRLHHGLPALVHRERQVRQGDLAVDDLAEVRGVDVRRRDLAVGAAVVEERPLGEEVLPAQLRDDLRHHVHERVLQRGVLARGQRPVDPDVRAVLDGQQLLPHGGHGVPGAQLDGGGRGDLELVEELLFQGEEVVDVGELGAGDGLEHLVGELHLLGETLVGWISGWKKKILLYCFKSKWVFF